MSTMSVAFGRQHGDDDAGASHGLRVGAESLAARGDECGTRSFRRISAVHLEARRDEAPRHGQAHLSEADHRHDCRR
jgi:hypothetical protein